MTITNALSPARAQAFHSTASAQQKRGGHVQFSLPPVSDATAPPGSSTPAAGKGAPPTGASAPNRTLLPIATPIAALNEVVPAPPAQPVGTPPPTTSPRGPGVTLPIAPAPSTANSALGATATGTVLNNGNLVSARLISRLYQRQG